MNGPNRPLGLDMSCPPLPDRAAELAEAMGVRKIQLSLTHSRELAMAVVVVEE